MKDNVPSGAAHETRPQVRRHIPGIDHGTEHAVLIEKDFTFFRPHPDPAAVIREGARHSVVRDLRSVAPVEHGKPHAIKPNEPFLCGQPQISIWCLRQPGNGVLRKTIVGRPYVDARLGGDPCRYEQQHRQEPSAEQCHRPASRLTTYRPAGSLCVNLANDE